MGCSRRKSPRLSSSVRVSESGVKERAFSKRKKAAEVATFSGPLPMVIEQQSSARSGTVPWHAVDVDAPRSGSWQPL